MQQRQDLVGDEDEMVIVINVPNLKYFTEGNEDTLLRHLQASPEWRVFTERGEIICYMRKREAGRWRVTLHGYQDNLDEIVEGSAKELQTFRYLFRFSENPGGSSAKLRYFTKAGPLAHKVRLRLESSDQGIESYLAVGEGSLWFEFYERVPSSSSATQLERTQSALKWLDGFLGKLRKAETEVSKSGYAAELIPPGGIRKGKPSIEIEDGSQPGIYNVYAWVNPGAMGEVYLKVLDVKTNRPLSEKSIMQASNERIGWAKDPGRVFFYNSEVTICEGAPKGSFDARFELWCMDSKTGKETELLETNRTIIAWER